MFWDCMPTYQIHLVWVGGQEAICVFPKFLSIPSFFIPGATGARIKMTSCQVRLPTPA